MYFYLSTEFVYFVHHWSKMVQSSTAAQQAGQDVHEVLISSQFDIMGWYNHTCSSSPWQQATQCWTHLFTV